MRRQLIGLLSAFTATAAIVVAQGAAIAPQDPASPDKRPEVTMTGCLIQGSAPTVFILDNARLDPQKKTEMNKTYVVVAATEDLDLIRHVNQEVQLSGMAEDKPVPLPIPGQRTREEDLPKFTAKALNFVADTCTTIFNR